MKLRVETRPVGNIKLHEARLEAALEILFRTLL